MSAYTITVVISDVEYTINISEAGIMSFNTPDITDVLSLSRLRGLIGLIHSTQTWLGANGATTIEVEEDA